MKKLISLMLGSFLTLSLTQTVYAKDNFNVSRIQGRNRFETSENICNKYASYGMKNLIIANGENYADALTGSVLSKKLDAPILLANKDIFKSSEPAHFIMDNLNKNMNIYVLGGSGVISNDSFKLLKEDGYNVTRLGGKDRFDTNNQIINFMNVKKGTPVILVNTNGFADPLSISSVASIKSYPILMVNKNEIPSIIKEQIKKIQPSKVFLIGGTGVLDNSLIENIKSLNPNINTQNIIRLGGKNRYDTSLKICDYFKKDVSNEYSVIASGKNFPDALSGSALASKLNAPIVLSDGNNIISQSSYLKSFSNKILLGGKGAISEVVESMLNGESQYLFRVDKAYYKDGKKYIHGNFKKEIRHIDEALQYEKITGEKLVSYEDGEPVIFDDCVDATIGRNFTLPVKDNIEISLLDEYSAQRESCNFDEFKKRCNESSKLIKMNFENGQITSMNQIFRP